jgi:two-component system chemotaxis response regulator CheB
MNPDTPPSTPSPPLHIIVVGASTGGTRILPIILGRLKPLRACILIVQHMPEFINASFVKTLKMYCPMPVCLASNGTLLQNGVVLVAPGGIHCSLVQNKSIRLWQGERVNFVCPSIDVTMKSLQPPEPGGSITGIILTGMGRDGAAGIIHIKQLGGLTLAQDHASSAIFGMPDEAARTGCVDQVLNPAEISILLNRLFA